MKYVKGYKGSVWDRFWSKVKAMPNGCLQWVGSTSENGYGYFRPDGKALRVHVWIYEMMVGAVPDGMELDHLCRNRACVNPDHLQPVTHLENMRRGFHAQKTHCKNGHPLSGDNVRVTDRQRVCRQCERDRERKRVHHDSP